MASERKALTFQQIILTLQNYWSDRGCALLQPVSYTHLDVYKRQYMHYVLMLSFQSPLYHCVTRVAHDHAM